MGNSSDSKRFMRQSLLLIFLVITTSFCYADEPPSWSPYKIISENKEFFCWIDYADKETLKDPWERKWNLKIYGDDSTLIWKRVFNPSGYHDGTLSNDGSNFIIIEFWYYENENVVEVYNRNSNDYFIKGKEFKIFPIFLETTVSHELWRKSYEYKDDKILIETNDSNIWEIDLTNRELNLQKNKSFLYTIGITISIVLILLIVFINYKRRK